MTSQEQYNNHSHNNGLYMNVSQWWNMNNIITMHIIWSDMKFGLVFQVCYTWLDIYIYIYIYIHVYILTLHSPKNCSYLCFCSVILVIFVCKSDILFCNSLHSQLTAFDCFRSKINSTSCIMEITRTIGVALWTDRGLVGRATPCSLLYNYLHLKKSFAASVIWMLSAET